MKDNVKDKKYEIVLLLLTIGTVIATLIGVSFAYYAARINLIGEGGSVVGNTANVGEITFDGGTDFQNTTDIEPGWEQEKTVTVKSTSSNLDRTILVKLDYENNMPDLELSVTLEGTDSDGNVTMGGSTDLDTSGEAKSLVLATIHFPKSEKDVTYTFKVKMSFPLTDEDQNDNQGKTFDGTLYAEYESINLE